MEREYFDVNKASWNQRAEVHFDSEFYDLESFVQGRSSLQSIELQHLGNIEGLKILHPMCHFGQDSLSLARMGATVTGADLSDRAIEKAKELAKQISVPATFINCNYYDLPNHLTGKFDILYSSYGVIGWLPDLTKWAEIAFQFTKKGGRLLLVEFHPFVWMYDDEFKKIQYSYFNDELIKTEDASYTDKESHHKNEFISWNHPLSEVITALLSAGFKISALQEYNYSPYNCFSNTYEFEKGKYRIQNFDDKVPYVYAIEAISP